MPKRAFAMAAHPDDIEFLMAGTLILLGQAGYELHYLNIANGSCGTARHTREEIIRIRREEARAAAAAIGAVYHESLVDDLEIFYERGLLAKVAAVMREVAPEILLLQSPVDYMEDHQNAARLAVTAAFCRGMLNFVTDPPYPPIEQEVTVYHAQPHGNRDPLRRVIRPEIYVDISGVLAQKRAMLACHRSQKAWLDESQGMDSYLVTMENLSREVGVMSGRHPYAEGWRRRLHLGFGAEGADPLSAALAVYVARASEDQWGHVILAAFANRSSGHGSAPDV
jgi:LmbE family N-acetylglucosaminyl deacetylase